MMKVLSKFVRFLVSAIIFVLFFILTCETPREIFLDYLTIKKKVETSSHFKNTKKIDENQLIFYKDSLLILKLLDNFDQEQLSKSEQGTQYSNRLSISLDYGVFSRLTHAKFIRNISNESPDFFLINVINEEVKRQGGERLDYSYTLLPNSVGKIVGSYYCTSGRFEGLKQSFTIFVKYINENEALFYSQYAIGSSDVTKYNYNFLLENIEFLSE